MKKNNRGFTLLELMIVIAIIGILAAVGYPAYTSHVRKANRADAIDSLLSLAGRMEEYYINNDSYDGAAVANATSSDGLYTLSITSATDFAYSLTATTVPAGVDTECGNLIYNSLGQKSASTGATDCW